MDLCLISCNIRFDNPADGQNSWKYRRDFLCQTLLKHEPSIIATQEGRVHQLNQLKASLKNFDITDQHRSWIGERMYPSIFLRHDKFEFLGSGDMWLSETPDIAGSHSFESAFPRLMTWTKIQIKESEQKLFIANTHLDHVKSETRVSQAKVLVEAIRRIWDEHSPLIIMGDFNDSPDSNVREVIVKAFPFLQDPWRIMNLKEETSYHAFKGETNNGSRIDWILVDNKLTIKNCLMDQSTLNNIYPSDHYPIVCTIKI